MSTATPDLQRMALAHMEAAIDLLDQSTAPFGTVEYLDLAINNLAGAVDCSGETQLRQLIRTQHFDEIKAV